MLHQLREACTKSSSRLVPSTLDNLHRPLLCALSSRLSEWLHRYDQPQAALPARSGPHYILLHSAESTRLAPRIPQQIQADNAAPHPLARVLPASVVRCRWVLDAREGDRHSPRSHGAESDAPGTREPARLRRKPSSPTPAGNRRNLIWTGGTS